MPLQNRHRSVYKCNGRTLKAILKSITPQDLKDRNTPIWTELLSKISAIVYHKDRDYRILKDHWANFTYPEQKSWPKWFHTMRKNRRQYSTQQSFYYLILKAIQKRYKLKLVQYYTTYDHKIGPQSCLKAYYAGEDSGMQEDLVWVTPEDFHESKEVGNIIWCPFDKNWWGKTSTKQINTYKDNKKYTLWAAFPPLQKAQAAKACPSCKEWWLTKDFVYNKYSETKTCKDCQTTKKDNPKIEKDFIRQYHMTRLRGWQFLIQRTIDPKDQETMPMGVEVEVQTIHGSRELFAKEVLQYQYAHPQLGNNIYFELDGSLADGGLECITNPMTLNYHKNYWPVMLPKMREHAVGWNVHKYTKAKEFYGIHITFNRRYFSDPNIIRFQHFWAYDKNKTFIHAIAQRAVMYNQGEMGIYDKPIVGQWNKSYKGKLVDNERRGFVAVKGDLIEVRAFNSTLNTESFIKNLEFVEAYQQYCKETPYNIHYQNFLLWLMSKPAHLFRYQNLISYLHRTYYPVKFTGGMKVRSEWENLMVLRPLKMHHKKLPDYLNLHNIEPDHE